MAVDLDLRLLRLLVRSTNASELLDDTLASLLVQALGISLLRNLDGDVNVDLDERKAGAIVLAIRALGRSLVDLPGEVAVLSVRTDERCNGNGSAVSEELGDLGDTADVLVAILLGESEVGVQTEANVVAVETVCGEVVGTVDESLLKSNSDCGLARGGETGEPDGEALLAAELGALGVGDVGSVVGDVAASD